MIRHELEERFAQGDGLLKTFVLEAHAQGEPAAFLAGMARTDGRLEETDDAHVHRLRSASADFVVDHLDERFWSFHTWSGAAEAYRSLKTHVESRRDLDWTWLPSGQLRSVWAAGRPTWLKCEFLGDRTLPEDQEARNVQLKMSGQDPGRFIKFVEGSSYGSAIAVDQIGIAVDDPEFGHVQEAVGRRGRFVARGDSFALHQEVIRLTTERYRRLVELVEARSISWGGTENTGITLEGGAIALRFSRPVPDMERLVEELFSCREPFRLWGIPRNVEGGGVRVEAVDLHVGRRVRIELTPELLRIHVVKGCCGNTVARLVANLQHRFDARISFLSQELQAALEPSTSSR